MRKLNFIKLTFIFFLAINFSSKSYGQKQQNEILSPDGKINMQLSVSNGKLFYRILYKNKPVIEPSTLGLTINGDSVYNTTNCKLLKNSEVNTNFPWRGVHSSALNHYRDAVFTVENSTPASSYEFEARVFNDGVAFRYLFHAADSVVVKADNSTFRIAGGSTIWSQGDVGAYEGKYTEQKIEDIKEGQLAGPPLTIKLPKNQGYAAITEGGVLDFAGMSLKATGNNTFQANLATPVHSGKNLATPWRIIEIGADLNTLVNCDMVADVSPAPDKTLFPQGFATSWIRPGKSVWSWLADNGGVTFENMKRFSDFAGQLGIPYNLVDEGWSRWQDGSKDKWTLLKELVDYSKQRGVKNMGLESISRQKRRSRFKRQTG